jgi:hypothetical protein
VTKDVTSHVVTLVAAYVFVISGMGINLHTAWSQGATDVTGIIFVGLGIASDLLSFCLPRWASALWHQGSKARALAASGIYIVAFIYSIFNSIGFFATNLTDTTEARAQRITPAVELAQRRADTLAKSRADECKSGRGDRCRELEALERKGLDDFAAARRNVAEQADPQVSKSAALIEWLTLGRLKSSPDDIAMWRLLLMVLLPQLGGLLFWVARP